MLVLSQYVSFKSLNSISHTFNVPFSVPREYIFNPLFEYKSKSKFKSINILVC